MESIFEKCISWKLHECIECHTLFALPVDVDNRLRQSHETFCCPFGHKQYYPGKTDAEKWKDHSKILENQLKCCKSDKEELFDEIKRIDESRNQLLKDNINLRRIKTRYKNKLKKEIE